MANRVGIYPTDSRTRVWVMQEDNKLHAMCSKCNKKVQHAEIEDGIAYWACGTCRSPFSDIPESQHHGTAILLDAKNKSLVDWVRAWTGLEVEIEVKT